MQALFIGRCLSRRLRTGSDTNLTHLSGHPTPVRRGAARRGSQRRRRLPPTSPPTRAATAARLDAAEPEQPTSAPPPREPILTGNRPGHRRTQPRTARTLRPRPKGCRGSVTETASSAPRRQDKSPGGRPLLASRPSGGLHGGQNSSLPELKVSSSARISSSFSRSASWLRNTRANRRSPSRLNRRWAIRPS